MVSAPDAGGFLPFARPDIDSEEAEAALDVIRSGWLTTGARCAEFERAFAEAVGGAHAVAVNSCTAAMHLSLEALGVTRGDCVVTTPYTFAATAEVIRYFDAVPVFVDVDPETCNIDVDQLTETVERLCRRDRAALPPAARDAVSATPPRVVMPVHVAGVPCDLPAIYDVAASSGAAVVEDAAHAFPASIDGRIVGGAVADGVRSTVCFSFYATKTITTGEGGMLVTHDAEVADRARLMSLHGMSRGAWTRYAEGGSWRYEVVAPGFKYNMPDLMAAIGLVQLSKATAMTARRAEIARRYNDAFHEEPSLQTPSVPQGAAPAWHLYMLRLREEAVSIDRGQFIVELGRRGIGTSVHFIPLHLHRYYRDHLGYRPKDFPVATAQFEREISLPIYSSMTDRDVERVCETVLDVVDLYRR